MKIITMDDFEEIAKRHEEWAKTREGERPMLLEDVFVNGYAEREICNNDLSYSNCRRSEFIYCRFQNVIFKSSFFSRTRFLDCFFDRCDFSGVSAVASNFDGSQFAQCKMDSAQFAHNSLRHTYWWGCRGENFDLGGCNLSKAFFDECCNFPALALNGNVCVGELKGLPIYQCSRGFGSRDGSLTLYALGKREDWLWYAGCFEGSEAELRREIKEKHGNRVPGKRYLKAIDYLVDTANSVDTPHS